MISHDLSGPNPGNGDRESLVRCISDQAPSKAQKLKIYIEFTLSPVHAEIGRRRLRQSVCRLTIVSMHQSKKKKPSPYCHMLKYTEYVQKYHQVRKEGG
jgi:hypothetical protein